jgi:uncharacterized membrane protein YbhN (UPF0104 family)
MAGVTSAANAVSPIGDRSRLLRLAKVVGWIAAGALLLVALDAFGVDVGGWLGGLWDTLGAVAPAYLVAAIAVQTLQIALNALAWLYILRAGYPHAKIPYAPILTAYTVGNALNAVLPAKLGAFVMLFMFVAIIPGSTFAGVFAGFLVEKIFFTVTGALVYVYLFIAVPGSFSVELGGLREHSWLTALIVIGAVALIVVLARVFWAKLRELWLQAKQGGAILSTPRRYLVQVVLPCLGGYIARLAVIGIMLAAFSIPVTFNSIMHVVAGNSIASNAAATPGGAGVTQAMSVVALKDYTDPQTATAYSVSQQLLTTAWSVAFALILVLTVFGWTNGRAMVRTAYSQAKDRATERRKGSEQEPGSAAPSVEG